MRTALKTAALSFALLATVLRAVLPQGWMPSTQESAAPIMLCPGMTHVPSAPGHQSDHDRGQGTACIFAAAAPLSSPERAVATPLSMAVPSSITFAATRDEAVLPRADRANAARAPPA